ncbi:Hypothetical protein PHPALM_15696 [Phytophthora palmivora]|uniref:Uncharacterized protein n=1 Tax=Phytophthora palmivora TaxID=4796 RepID=A0A2P4XRH5_9STRA|nr:Hypothetical protein PHPALM_15696 [Phytophthora palmivora]
MQNRHDRERRRDDSRPRVTVANALTDLVAALNVNDATRSRSNRPETRHHAANDSERRAAAEGTFARSDHRHPRGGNGHFNKGRGYGRDNRQRQYGPCAACSSMSHSVHYCYRRCKLCKQVHDAGKCDAHNELTNLLRSKVDKKDLTPELQSLVFGNHLN